jgi:TP901 family phage tail tape measure protein
MSENVLLRIGATFGKNVAKDLQRELDALSKQLKLTIKDVNLAGTKVTQSSNNTADNVTKAHKKQMDSIDKLINRYKSAQLTFEKFQEYGRKIAENDRFKEKSLDKQAKLYGALESSAKKYHQVLSTEKKYNDAILEQNKKIAQETTKQKSNSSGKSSSISKTNINYLMDEMFPQTGIKAKDVAKTYQEYFDKIGTVVSKSTIHDAIDGITKHSGLSAKKSADVYKQAFDEIDSKSRLAIQNQQKFNDWVTNTGSSNLPTSKTSMFNVGKEESKGRNQQFESSFMPNLQNVSKSARESASVFDELFSKAEKSKMGLSSIEKQTVKLSGGFKNVNKDGYAFGDMLAQGWKKMAVWSIAATGFYLPIRALQDMIKVITEVDSQLIEINKVLDLSQAELKQLTSEATNVGIAYGRTTVEVLKATAAFAKAGLGREEAEKLGQLALLLANVGDISVETAQETLIAANAGFQLNNSYGSLLGVIDKFNAIANQNATEVKDMAAAWEVSASTAKMAGLSIDQYNALIGTAQSTTQRSGSEIGNAWKTILMRMQGVSDGMETLDEDISKAEEALNSVGIAARNSEKDFRPAMDVLQELSNKFDELSTVEKSYVTEALAGKYRANILKSTLQNFNMVNKQIIESANASGSALKENAVYLEGIEAKTKRLSAMWEQFSITFASSDVYKGMIDFLSSVTQTSTRVIETFGGLNTILITLATVGLTKFLISLASVAAGESALTVMTVGLSVAMEGLNMALMTLLSNPITWIIAAIGAIGIGTVAWINHSKKLEEQTAATTSAQNNFNKSLDNFNRTLDTGAISEMREEIEKLKKALDYDEVIKKINSLNVELEKANKTVGNTAYPNVLKKQIEELNKSLSPITDKQQKLNKKIEESKAINIEAQKAQINKTVATIKEIEQDKKLAKEYDELISSGKDDITIRDQLLNKYPQFLTRLGEHGDKLGVNTGKLNTYLDVQTKVAKAEIANSQIEMRASMEKTKQMINDTTARIAAKKAELALTQATDPEEMMNQFFGKKQSPYDFTRAGGNQKANQLLEDRKKGIFAQILESERTLDSLSNIVSTQNDYLNLSPDDIIKAYSTTSPGFIPENADKDKNKGMGSDAADLNPEKYELDLKERTYDKQQILDDTTTALEMNRSEQEKGNLTTKQQIDLMKQEVELMRAKRSALNELTYSQGQIAEETKAKMQNIGVWFDSKGNMSAESYDTIRNAKISEFNTLGDKMGTTKKKDDKGNITKEWQSIEDRRKWLKVDIDNLKKWSDEYIDIRAKHNKGMIDLNKELGDIYKSEADIEKFREDEGKKLADIAQKKLDAIESTEKLIQDMIKKGVEKQKDLYEEDLDNYKKVTDAIIDENERKWASDDFNKDMGKQQKERQLLQNEINILSSDTSFGGKTRVRELKLKLAEMDEKITDDNEKRKRELIKQSLEDSLKAKEEDIGDKKKLLDDEFSDEKIAAISRQSLVNQSLDNVTSKFPDFFKNLSINTSQSFLGILKDYNSKYGGELNDLVTKAKIATEEIKNLNLLKTQADESTYSFTPPIEKAKEDIGKLQDKWWQIEAMVRDGVANSSDLKMQASLKQQATEIRNKFGISDKEVFQGYVAKPQSLVGTHLNGGMNTRNGYVQLHGTQASPEWIFNSNQMNSFIRNMIASSGNYVSAAGGGGLNLSIVVNGNADQSTITGIKNAGMNIISQIKKSINKNGTTN